MNAPIYASRLSFIAVLLAVVTLQPLSAQPTSIWDVEQGERTIWRYDDPSGPGTAVVESPEAGTPVRIALDHVNRKVYWTDNAGRILRANRNGSDVETVVDALDNPVGVAIDGDEGYVYWTDPPANKIYRKAVSGAGSIETLANSEDGVDNPPDIQLNPQDNTLYWVNVGAEGKPGDGDGSIYRMTYEGVDVQPVLSKLDNPVSLALDPEDQRIYWADRGTGEISHAPLPPDGSEINGADIETISTSTYPQGLALDLKENVIYWTHDPISGGGADSGSIYQYDLQSGSSPIETIGGLDHPVGIAVNTEAPLPVELTAFDAVTDGTAVTLSWTTASETNNAGFEVEWAVGGGAFEQVGFVEGHGTTTETQHYTYRVPDVSPGTHTFRLRQIDVDGTAAYGPEVEVQVGLGRAYALSAPYPNPFVTQAAVDLTVRRSQHVTVAVYDALGRRIRTLFDGPVDAHTPQTFRFEAGRLSSGVYLYRVVGETFAETRAITHVQ